MRWPEPATIALPKHTRIVLQLGRSALEETGNDPATTAKCLDPYKNVITDVLVDASGGCGIPIDLDVAHAYIHAIHGRHPQFGIGVAGGLSSQTVGRLQPLVNIFPKISLDAEGRLRTATDHLDIEEMKNYISVADGLFD